MAKKTTKGKKDSKPASAPAQKRDLLTRVERDFLAKMGEGPEAEAAGVVLVETMDAIRHSGSEKAVIAAGRAGLAQLNVELAKIDDGAKRAHLKSCVHSAVRFGVQKCAGVAGVKEMLRDK